MMYLNQLMRSQRLTKAELSRQSGIPETTLRDLLSGSVRLENWQGGHDSPPCARLPCFR